MSRSIALVLVAILATVVLAEEVKEECKNRPEGDSMHCCSMPVKDLDKTIKCLVNQKEEKDAGCSSSCFFNGINLVKNGQIDRPVLLTAVKDLFVGTDKGFDSLHVKAIEYCTETYAKMVESQGDKQKNPNCDRSKNAVAWCLYGYYFMNCPAAVWTESSECNAFKKYATDCSGMRHGHH